MFWHAAILWEICGEEYFPLSLVCAYRIPVSTDGKHRVNLQSAFAKSVTSLLSKKLKGDIPGAQGSGKMLL